MADPRWDDVQDHCEKAIKEARDALERGPDDDQRRGEIRALRAVLALASPPQKDPHKTVQPEQPPEFV